MKFIVTAENDSNFAPVSDLTFPLIQEYCDRHGYEFRPKVVVNPERDSIWERVRSLQSALPDCDWAVHVDADWMPTNMNVDLEDFVDEGKCIVIPEVTTEAGQLRFNDGFLMVKNSDLAAHILQWTWDNANRPEDGLFCLQDGLQLIWNKGMTVRGAWNIEKQRRCNSFLYAEYKCLESTRGNWRKGDFALHLPGMTTQRRVELINQYKEKIIR